MFVWASWSLCWIPAGFLGTTTSILHKALNGQAAGKASQSVTLITWSTSEQTAQQWKAKSPARDPWLSAKQADKCLSQSWKSDWKSSLIRFSSFSKTSAAQKSRHTIANIREQPIWALTARCWFSPHYSGCGTGNSSSTLRSSSCCSFFTFPHLYSRNQDLLPASQPFSCLPQPCFAVSCLFSRSSPIASETQGQMRRQGDKHKHPSLQHQQRQRQVLCQGGGWHFLGAEHKLCGTPSPPYIGVSQPFAEILVSSSLLKSFWQPSLYLRL